MKKNLIEVREENEGAFTLIELLVVILIIGILAAIAIPVFLNQRKAAVDAAVKSDVKNAATQVEAWAVAHPSSAIPGITIENGKAPAPSASPSPTPTADGSMLDIKASQGTKLVVEAGTKTGSYTITGTNLGGVDSAKTDGIVYNSDTGGLSK